ncbi:MAG TPA: alanine racemase [Acidimicrobiales bacterium]|nr:alanine racemase [Acidimicrobiales bacterium]
MRCRPAWAEVDLGAVRGNTAALAALAAPAALCAVVKAGAYGHGAVPVARAALEGGASWLAVALVDEAAELREARITAPVLLLSEPSLDALPDAVALGLTPTLYSLAGVEAAAKAVVRTGRTTPLPVHVKVDTGMHRVGAQPEAVASLAVAVQERTELRLEGLWTHFAVADDPDNPFTAEQHRRFTTAVDDLAAHGIRPPLLHTCNSAGTIAHPSSRHELVRCGIALYGVAPSPALEGIVELRPAMSLHARVAQVKQVGAGDGISYGLRYRFERRSVVATVPLGYADGVPWRLAAVGGEVLVGGRRRPIAGSVTMDQITVDCGDDGAVAPGDEVVLLGRQGDESIDAWEWARRLGTIAYEVVCGIGPRVHRTYVGG